MWKSGKKYLITYMALVLLIGVLLAGCGNATSGTAQTPAAITQQTVKAKNMRISFVISQESIQNKAVVKFKELVEKYTNSAITVEIYPGGQLGADLSSIQQLQSGVLEATLSSTAPAASIVPELNLFDLPFLFKDQKTAETVLNGPAGQSLLDKMPDKGIIGLAFWDYGGFRELTNSKHPIKTMEDLKGLKLRVLQNSVHIDFWKALGANPTPMSFDQLFNALQQHVIDAQENPIPLINDQKYFEVQKYLTLTNHVYTPFLFMVSKIWYEGLTEEQQKALKKAAQEAGQYDLQLNQQQQETVINSLKQHGMQFDSISDDVRKQMVQTVQPVVDQYVAKYGDAGKQFIDSVNKANTQ
jgi:tripartite ATP-independent transporter DctP family solute receptor